MITNPFYFLREALASIRRNWVMSVAAVTTVAVSLVVLGSFVILATTLGSLINTVESRVEIKVFLKDSASEEEVASLEGTLRAWEEVRAVKFISKEEALERLRKDLKSHPEMLEALSGNPLPASLEVKLVNPQSVNSVAKRLNSQKVVDDLQYGRDIVKKLFRVTDVVRWIGIVFTLLLWFASLVIIVNTIRLAIFSRRKEVGIMKLVGATNWFIRWPFVMEGVLQGVVGALVAVGILYLADTFLLNAVLNQITFLGVQQSTIDFSKLGTGLASAGVFIGALGSLIALRRFLRV